MVLSHNGYGGDDDDDGEDGAVDGLPMMCLVSCVLMRSSVSRVCSVVGLCRSPVDTPTPTPRSPALTPPHTYPLHVSSSVPGHQPRATATQSTLSMTEIVQLMVKMIGKIVEMG